MRIHEIFGWNKFHSRNIIYLFISSIKCSSLTIFLESLNPSKFHGWISMKYCLWILLGNLKLIGQSIGQSGHYLKVKVTYIMIVQFKNFNTNLQNNLIFFPFQRIVYMSSIFNFQMFKLIYPTLPDVNLCCQSILLVPFSLWIFSNK